VPTDLPDGPYESVLTGERLSLTRGPDGARLGVAAALGQFPVALLRSCG
jgi:hypothetical protein